MEQVKTFFFDSYAFFELIEKNERYLPYADGVGIVTTRLHLMELHHHILKRHGKEKANFFYNRLVVYAQNPSDEVIMGASELKEAMKKKNLSYIDCIGYVMARSMGIPYLTGDKEFSDLDGVEFVQ